MSQMPRWVMATAYPGRPLEAFLVPQITQAERAAAFRTFYFGINRWSNQWQRAHRFHRRRWEVPTIPIDNHHRIATLQACIAGTVAAYQAAANALLSVQPDSEHNVSTMAERVIYQGLGHGSRADATHVTTADFGSQLHAFGAHEFRVARITFDVYRHIRDGNGGRGDFNAALTMGGQLMTPKQKAQQLLAFDGLCAIRRAAQAVVKRIRIVTCNIGRDTVFLDQLAWVLGRPRTGEPPYSKITIEAYERQVDARQANDAAPFRIGLIEDPDHPDNVSYEPNAESEPPAHHLVTRDPTEITAPNPSDPLPVPPNIALSLGDCRSVSHLIPPDVLLQ